MVTQRECSLPDASITIGEMDRDAHATSQHSWDIYNTLYTKNKEYFQATIFEVK